jgi:putative FmdB family regulatory protein
MPTYVYAPKGPDAQTRQCEVCAAGFETVQRMKDEALTRCPKCGGEIERVVLAPNLGGVGFMGRKPSADRMAQAGFVQYKRCGKGYYEKQFGKAGPPALHGE